MQKWGYGCNNLYKHCHVHLEEGPWWVFALMDFTPWLCECIPEWRVPLLRRFKLVEDGETYTYAQWYGETLQELFCGLVDHPVTWWAYRRIKTTSVDLPWDQCRAIFYKDDPARWDEWESDPEFGCYEGMTVEQMLEGLRQKKREGVTM